MAELTLAVWNMEWLNELFVADDDDEAPAFRPRDARPPITKSGTIGERLDDLAGVIEDIEPDLLVLTEGPSRADELQLLFDSEMPGTWVTCLEDTPGSQQNIGIALRTDGGKFADPVVEKLLPPVAAAFGPFQRDTDDDEIAEHYHFERTPLYVEVTRENGAPFRILGLHLKSKGIFRSYEWSKWWALADANRRKILAQTYHLRETFIDPYLSGDETKQLPLIVCGDINDGPGMDTSERRLLGSGIEQLMGCIWRPAQCLRNALFESLDAEDQKKLKFGRLATTRFRDPIFNDAYHHVWIDHVLYSDNTGNQWVTGAEIHKEMPDGSKIWQKYPHSSDHYPVTVRLHT